METIGKRIEELRYKNNLTLDDLSKHLGISKTAVRKYETGATKNIKYENVEKLAQLFNVSVDYLLNGTKEETPEDKLIKILIDKTLENKIEWVTKDYILSYEPLSVDKELVRYEMIENYLSEYFEYNINYFWYETRFSFTSKQMFIFISEKITDNNSKYNHILFFGNAKSLIKIEENKNLENLYLAIHKPLTFINTVRIESIISDLENL
ncbi:helix-turn-helix domain-containing protein [Peptoanaerobacter stomatis]|uniref:helix-turn-helix domain-containing protein n=1 Tax=Peptoanaerobacter stomatis TaxID=796937 RepID=UPI003F9F50EC